MQHRKNVIFCKELRANEDDKYYILERRNNNYTSLAHFPYTTNGHLLVLPKDHVRSLDMMMPTARAEMIEIINDICHKYQNAKYDVSVGFNIGKSAGAGIPAHLHGHIVPYSTQDTDIVDSIEKEEKKNLNLNHIYKQTKKLLSGPIDCSDEVVADLSSQCNFCSDIRSSNDAENFVLKRYKNHLISLSRQPYTLGHLMISPLDHVRNLNNLTIESRSELIELAATSCTILKKCMNVTDFNVGFNLSKKPAIGFADHFSMQVMP